MTLRLVALDRIEGSILLPPSKSIANRALMMTAWSSSQKSIENLPTCDDTTVMVKALQQQLPVIDIGASGTAMRFLTAFFAGQPGKHILTGTDRMRQRPIKLLVEALRYLGGDIEYLGEEGFPPLQITGKNLQGGEIHIPGTVSSQYVSALLMLGATLPNGLQLTLIGTITSRPYIDLTLSVMREFGAKADWVSNDTIKVCPQGYQPTPYRVESDWTAASYWYEIMALCGADDAVIQLQGLQDGSVQGDAVVRHIFSLLGVKTVFSTSVDGSQSVVTLKKTAGLLPRMEYDFISSPDLAQTVVVCCVLRNIPFHFKGLASLHIKETDRVQALKNELYKLGYVLHAPTEGELYWDGERCQPMSAPLIDTYHDHRMAMCMSAAACVLPHIDINNPEVVSKSYPNFWNDLKQVGFSVTMR